MALLSAIILVPAAGAGLLYLFPGRIAWRIFALAAAACDLALVTLLAVQFDWQSGSLQFQATFPWIPSLGASYHLGVDGISLPLVLLTALLTFLALVFSWRQQHRPREFFALFLVMETGLMGVFITLDLLLFYLFWELTLVRMYFIIGLWGHEQRLRAALKFFLYTRVGSLAMLLAILGLYVGMSPRTFDLVAITAARPYSGVGLAPQLIALGFFVGFAIKLPVIPFHSWLPDAHTEAPTAGSVILAGLLLKMGGYGFLRLALPTVPDVYSLWSLWIVVLAVVSAVYGAAVAMAQPDLKRLVAVSSVNHMGYVLLAIGVAASAFASPADRTAATSGAVYQMVAHGLATGGLFFLVGMLSERTGTRQIRQLSGLWAAVPLYGTILAFTTFASLGLPALVHFAAEVQIVLAALGVYPWAAAAMLLGVLITTAMFLWTLQRVLMGSLPERWTVLPGLSSRELAVLLPLVGLILLLGVVPGPLTDLVHAAAQLSQVTPLALGR